MTAPVATTQIETYLTLWRTTYDAASTVSTIEAVIPYLILAGVIVFIALRLVGVSLVDVLERARRRKNERTE